MLGRLPFVDRRRDPGFHRYVDIHDIDVWQQPMGNKRALSDGGRRTDLALVYLLGSAADEDPKTRGLRWTKSPGLTPTVGGASRVRGL